MTEEEKPELPYFGGPMPHQTPDPPSRELVNGVPYADISFAPGMDGSPAESQESEQSESEVGAENERLRAVLVAAREVVMNSLAGDWDGESVTTYEVLSDYYLALAEAVERQGHEANG